MTGLSIRVDGSLPKLLVRINPETARSIQVKDLEEVAVTHGAMQRSVVAVAQQSTQVQPGELCVSSALLFVLNGTEADTLTIAKRLAAVPAAAQRRDTAPAPVTSAAGYNSRENLASRHSLTSKPGGAPMQATHSAGPLRESRPPLQPAAGQAAKPPAATLAAPTPPAESGAAADTKPKGRMAAILAAISRGEDVKRDAVGLPPPADSGAGSGPASRKVSKDFTPAASTPPASPTPAQRQAAAADPRMATAAAPRIVQSPTVAFRRPMGDGDAAQPTVFRASSGGRGGRSDSNGREIPVTRIPASPQQTSSPFGGYRRIGVDVNVPPGVSVAPPRLDSPTGSAAREGPRISTAGVQASYSYSQTTTTSSSPSVAFRRLGVAPATTSAIPTSAPTPSTSSTALPPRIHVASSTPPVAPAGYAAAMASLHSSPASVASASPPAVTLDSPKGQTIGLEKEPISPNADIQNTDFQRALSDMSVFGEDDVNSGPSMAVGSSRQVSSSFKAAPPRNMPLAVLPESNKQIVFRNFRKDSLMVGQRKNIRLGSLAPSLPTDPRDTAEVAQPLDEQWRAPPKPAGGTMEELSQLQMGAEAIREVERWLNGETSGWQCSQVVMDRALTVLSNLKLDKDNCDVEMLGGPLGAIVGGYSDAEWLHEDVFSKKPEEAIVESFKMLGISGLHSGDFSGVNCDEVCQNFRRSCVKEHPSRGGMPKGYLKLLVAMTVVVAFTDKVGDSNDRQMWNRAAENDFLLDDLTLAKELDLTEQQLAAESDSLAPEKLEEMNKALDEYILRQMYFKSEIVDEIARLHENSAYSILGVDSDATDAEIKQAFRLVAMQAHPDKGGSKEHFQELREAYERILEYRSANKVAKQKKDDKAAKKAAEEKVENEGKDKESDKDPDEDPSHGDLIAKVTKAANEASQAAETAVEVAHKAANAVRRAVQGDCEDTKAVVREAIVLSLTVVKSVRSAGYATMDAAAQCRIAAQLGKQAAGCAERAVTSMSLGLDALNAALTCAEITEKTASEVRSEMAPEEGGSFSRQCSRSSRPPSQDRFIQAATRASAAAASASNAAMSAAISAVEASRECMRAVQQHQKDKAEGKTEDDSKDSPEDGQTQDQRAAVNIKRLIAKRSSNHKVLQRLNSELFTHQQNVRQFLQCNRQLIPEVTGDAKQKVFRLLRNYCIEARQTLGLTPSGYFLRSDGSAHPAADSFKRVRELPLLVPFLQQQNVAIPVSIKGRVFKMAALYDLPRCMRTLDEELLAPLSRSLDLAEKKGGKLREIERISSRIREELSSNVAEAAGSVTQTTAGGG
eukprot:TRINITY_DN1431_c0_g1_i1.p1 TRINITY_DN1431_c0_g1~~TRINITY_DN1431_c0_g1_i1.p1  ORF type:complete len:1306 (-),score=363.88 TRINITY_DN1431_c0_g1_i1:204-4121(-)